uniref:C2H2-type domain-containing protein n=1 Tax=Anopheles farauti TaxID=69004 RepID=A0A182QAY5_9DIPT
MKIQSKIQKRRTRKTISPTDPAEALTEMSVRGLNLFRYATINAGIYQCLVCAKEGVQKTFKNKYSFQRHAFLYHEGNQRKVFPCPVCHKEFSRPDKMKNHHRMTHESFEANSDCLSSSAVYFLPPQCSNSVGEIPTLHLPPPSLAQLLKQEPIPHGIPQQLQAEQSSTHMLHMK